MMTVVEPAPRLLDADDRRALARAMPRGFPKGEWWKVRNIGRRLRQREGEPEPEACRLCHRAIKRNNATYYELHWGPEGWEDAVLHCKCADALDQWMGLDLHRTLN